MKRLLMYIFLIIIFILMPPFFFTSKIYFSNSTSIEVCKDEGISDDNGNISLNELTNQTAYDYKGFNKINLLDSDTGEILQIDLDEYLLGVVSAEMPASYDIEALKAQAVVARTYTLYTLEQEKHGNLTICKSSNCCQAWISKDDRMSKWEDGEKESNWNKIVEAVYTTRGQVITYNGAVIDAFFHANSGGVTEEPANVWGGNDYPYLKSVQTSGEENYRQYSSENTFSKEELKRIMMEKYNNFSIDWNDENCLSVLEYTDNGRVRFIKIGNVTISGVEARSMFGLKSTNFNITTDDSTVTFSVIGYGHGVGMSQTGADSMAKNGANYIDIIKHFYTDVEVKSI